jgi:hypothetical protein
MTNSKTDPKTLGSRSISSGGPLSTSKEIAQRIIDEWYTAWPDVRIWLDKIMAKPDRKIVTDRTMDEIRVLRRQGLDYDGIFTKLMPPETFDERYGLCEIDDKTDKELVDGRGGCNCAYLGSVGGAPCGACTADTTYHEFLEIARIITVEGLVIDLNEEWPDPDPPPPPPVEEFKSASDIMDAVRSMSGRKYK